MKLSISKNAHVNYLSKIVYLDRFAPHPNPEYTKLKLAFVDGFNIIVSIDMQEGQYVYFPAMSQINPDLLRYLNLYSHPEMNADVNKKGFFEKNGRVKAIRLGGHPSEGFLLPISDLKNWIKDSVNVELGDVDNNIEFDEVEHNGKTFWVSQKYIVQTSVPNSGSNKGNYRDKKLKRFDKLIDGQFAFHYDTVLIRKSPWEIKPDDIIHISSKWHGTSLISSYVLCKEPRSKTDKFLTKMYKKLGGTLTKYADAESYPQYDYIYSSRSVIKNAKINPTVKEGFYPDDVWKYGHEFLKPYLQKGMTMYAEIVGFLPNGSYIQKNYDYGCRAPRAADDYKQGTNFKVVVYRITLKNVDGNVHEFSPREVKTYCENCGIPHVIEFYYGYARDLYPELKASDHWNEDFIEHLANDKNFFMEENSPDCVNKVPHEGIVIKKDDMISRAWKLKSFAFMNKEQQNLDKGIVDVEEQA